MYARGRRQDVAGERRDGGGGEHDKDLSHTLRARSGREGGMKLGRERGESRVRGRERGRQTETCWLGSRVITGKSRGICQLPAGDSSTQPEGCCPAPLLSAGVLACVCVSVQAHSMEAAEC